MGSGNFAINLMIRTKIFGRSEAGFSAGRILMATGFLLLSCSNVCADIERGKQLYRENCAPCHGESGKGDGVGARSLPVRPADHTNGALMNTRTDIFLRDIILKGGSSMGLSAFMPAWQGIFKEQEILDLVGYIRSLAQPRN
jgi:mono/diheme cytochrome c family protein